MSSASPGRFGPSSRGEGPVLVAFTADGRREWTAGDLTAAAARRASDLKQRGFAPGDRFGLFAPASADWIIAAQGVLHFGGVAVPIDDRMSDDNLKSVLEDAGLAALLTDERGAERLEHLEAELPERLRLDREPESEEEIDPAEWEDDDTAVLFYTSGTTGPPKGVPLTPANLAFQWETVESLDLVRDDDRLLLPLPLHHVYPFVIGMLTPLKLGVPLVLPHALTGGELARAMREGGVTALLAVPRLLETFVDGLVYKVTGGGKLRGALFDAALWLCRHTGLGGPLFRPLRRRAGPDLRLMVSGGSPLDPELAETLDALGWEVAVGYGLTETSPLISVLRPGENRYHTVGRPVEGVELRLEKTEEEGTEIRVRGPGVFSEYHQRPEKTEESFDGGWFKTGDLGSLEDGFLKIHGRASTLLVLENGENVPPEPLEEQYAEAEGVGEIGLLCRDGKLAALAVPEGGVDEDALREALDRRAESMPSTRRIHDLRMSPKSLPRTRLGKIRRKELKERFDAADGAEREDRSPVDRSEMSSRDRALLDNPRAGALWELLADRYADRYLAPDSRLGDEAGIDSLEWVDLTMRIERETGVALDTQAIAELETVRDLLGAVSEASAEEGEGGADPLEDPDAVLDEDTLRRLRPRGRRHLIVGTPIFYLHKGLMRLLFRIHLHGLERLPDQGAFLFCPTHASYLDAPAIIARLPFQRLRSFYWAGFKRLMFANPFARWISRLGQVVPVDPELEPRKSLAVAARLLRDGHPLVWFPEGERSRDGSLRELRPGVGRLATKLDVPLVPVLLRGTHRALPPGRAIPRPGRIDIHIGEPLRAGGQDAEAVTRALRGALEELKREAEGG